MTITAQRLRDALRYDPGTGLLASLATGDAVGRIDQGGYVRVSIDGRGYLAHRLAWLYMTGEWPKDQVDHANRDRADNRWTNLREATVAQNAMNRPRRQVNRSGFKGVGWHSRVGRWQARIAISRHRVHLGYFDTPEAAYAAYVAAAHEHYGEFARVN